MKNGSPRFTEAALQVIFYSNRDSQDWIGGGELDMEIKNTLGKIILIVGGVIWIIKYNAVWQYPSIFSNLRNHSLVNKVQSMYHCNLQNGL